MAAEEADGDRVAREGGRGEELESLTGSLTDLTAVRETNMEEKLVRKLPRSGAMFHTRPVVISRGSN